MSGVETDELGVSFMGTPGPRRTDPRNLGPCAMRQRPGKEMPTAPEPRKRVRVNAPYQVSHDGRRFGPGETASVPQSLADQWVRSRWAEHVTRSK